MRAMFAICLMLTPALAHDDADWIRQQDLRSKTGQLCCGNGDCKPIDPANVRETDKGYLIAGTNEVIPYAETQPFSIDGRLWVCRSPHHGMLRPTDGRRCVFDRPGAT